MKIDDVVSSCLDRSGDALKRAPTRANSTWQIQHGWQRTTLCRREKQAQQRTRRCGFANRDGGEDQTRRTMASRRDAEDWKGGLNSGCRRVSPAAKETGAFADVGSGSRASSSEEAAASSASALGNTAEISNPRQVLWRAQFCGACVAVDASWHCSGPVTGAHSLPEQSGAQSGAISKARTVAMARRVSNRAILPFDWARCMSVFKLRWQSAIVNFATPPRAHCGSTTSNGFSPESDEC